jgi:hypothetical protein
MTTKAVRVVSDEQLGQFARRVHDLQTRLTKGAVNFKPVMDGLQLLIEGEGVIEAPKSKINLAELIAEWVELYREDGIELDVANIRIPKRTKGFGRLLVIAQGLKIQQAYDNCAKHFPVLKFDKRNLDEVWIKNDRDPTNGAYAIWVRDRVETDWELENLSANDLERRNIAGITLIERIQYGRKYYRETGNHLDKGNRTLCPGSRLADGRVAVVNWGNDKMRVDCCNSAYHADDLRARAVVL